MFDLRKTSSMNGRPSRKRTVFIRESGDLTKQTDGTVQIYPLVMSTVCYWKMAIDIVSFTIKNGVPSGYVKIAIENGHRNSEFYH